jgi:hypothetical protein
MAISQTENQSKERTLTDEQKAAATAKVTSDAMKLAWKKDGGKKQHMNRTKAR